MPALKEILDQALQHHPDMRQIVERHRPSVYSALGARSIRHALHEIAHYKPDVKALIKRAKEQRDQEGLDFSEEIADAYEACHSLDGMSSRRQFDHSEEVRFGLVGDSCPTAYTPSTFAGARGLGESYQAYHEKNQ